MSKQKSTQFLPDLNNGIRKTCVRVAIKKERTKKHKQTMTHLISKQKLYLIVHDLHISFIVHFDGQIPGYLLAD